VVIARCSWVENLVLRQAQDEFSYFGASIALILSLSKDEGGSPKRSAENHSNSAAFSFSNATARWLMASLAAGSISPKVWSKPLGMKIGS
jgi:hypothetical protein